MNHVGLTATAAYADWACRHLSSDYLVSAEACHLLRQEPLPWELAGRLEPESGMPFGARLRVRSSGPPSTSHAHNIRFPLTVPLRQGGSYLLLVWLRSTTGAAGEHVVEEAQEPYLYCLNRSFRVQDGWAQFWLPFRPERDAQAAKLRYQIWLPDGPVELEVSPPLLFVLGDDAPAPGW